MTEPFGPGAPGYLPVFWLLHEAGAIVGHGHCALADLDLQEVAAGRQRILLERQAYAAMVVDPGLFHVDVDALAERVASPIELAGAAIAADGEDEATITGIPAGSRLRVTGAVTLAWTAIDDGEAVLTCATPGTLRVRVESPPPYMHWEGIVHAT